MESKENLKSSGFTVSRQPTVNRTQAPRPHLLAGVRAANKAARMKKCWDVTKKCVCEREKGKMRFCPSFCVCVRVFLAPIVTY